MKANHSIFMRVFVSVITFVSLLSYTVVFHLNNTSAAPTEISAYFALANKNNRSILIEEPNAEVITVVNERQVYYETIKKEQERKAKEREDKIQRVIAFLKKQRSPVANYEIASKIIDYSAANNADFRVVLAIMGVESGFCRQSFWYNCFGYLNGVKYSSYSQAFNDLVPKVSRQYAARFGWNFEALAKAYGQKNWQKTSANMKYFANQI